MYMKRFNFFKSLFLVSNGDLVIFGCPKRAYCYFFYSTLINTINYYYYYYYEQILGIRLWKMIGIVKSIKLNVLSFYNYKGILKKL